MSEDINSNEVLIDCYDKSIYPENAEELANIQNYKELNNLYNDKIIGTKRKKKKDILEINYIYALLIAFLPLFTLFITLIENPEKQKNYVTCSIYICWVIIFALLFNNEGYFILFCVCFAILSCLNFILTFNKDDYNKNANGNLSKFLNELNIFYVLFNRIYSFQERNPNYYRNILIVSYVLLAMFLILHIEQKDITTIGGQKSAMNIVTYIIFVFCFIIFFSLFIKGNTSFVFQIILLFLFTFVYIRLSKFIVTGKFFEYKNELDVWNEITSIIYAGIIIFVTSGIFPKFYEHIQPKFLYDDLLKKMIIGFLSFILMIWGFILIVKIY